MKSILIIILSIMLLSCGFKPINLKNEKLIYIKNIDVKGATRSAYFLKNNILLISDNNSKNIYDIELKITKKENSKIKNKSGRTTRYNLLLVAELELKNLNNKIETKKMFFENGDYEVATIHSNTINNKNSVEKDIIQKLSEDIVTYIALSMRNK